MAEVKAKDKAAPTKAVAAKPAQERSLIIGEWSREQVDLIKRTVAKNTTDDELKLFLYTCNRVGLDPLLKQIHAVKRWDTMQGQEVMSIQTGIDGYRLIAHRTKEMDGQDGPYWCGDDGVWQDVWTSSQPPKAAKMIVYRKGHAHPYTGIARFEAYMQKKKDGGMVHMWAKMGDGQIAKCAEALALRKAFPAELGPIRAEEELQHVEDEPTGLKEPGQVAAPAANGKIIDADVTTERAEDHAAAPAAAAPAPAKAPAEKPGIVADSPHRATIKKAKGFQSETTGKPYYVVDTDDGYSYYSDEIIVVKAAKEVEGKKIPMEIFWKMDTKSNKRIAITISASK